MPDPVFLGACMVHCHVGSLEKQVLIMIDISAVHCHVGSLENHGGKNMKP